MLNFCFLFALLRSYMLSQRKGGGVPAMFLIFLLEAIRIKSVYTTYSKYVFFFFSKWWNGKIIWVRGSHSHLVNEKRSSSRNYKDEDNKCRDLKNVPSYINKHIILMYVKLPVDSLELDDTHIPGWSILLLSWCLSMNHENVFLTFYIKKPRCCFNL